jgi:hypothetical protein
MGIPHHWNKPTRVSFGAIRRQLDGATLSERNEVLEFIRSNMKRIRPPVDDDWLYDAMSSYLLDCIVDNADSDVEDESTHSSFEAAHELVDWFNWIVKRDDTPAAIRSIVERITNVFNNGDRFVRNCIETGFLEHVLETPSNRPYFLHWSDDPILAESYTEALRWGEAHTRRDAPQDG